MPKTTSGRGTTVTVRVGPNMKRDIQAYAKAREMSLGEFVRYCVWTYIDSTPIDQDAELAEWNEENQRQIDSGTFGPRLEVAQVKHG